MEDVLIIILKIIRVHFKREWSVCSANWASLLCRLIIIITDSFEEFLY
jgi:hypothetical protein